MIKYIFNSTKRKIRVIYCKNFLEENQQKMMATAKEIDSRLFNSLQGVILTRGRVKIPWKMIKAWRHSKV